MKYKKGVFVLLCMHCYAKYESWDMGIITSIHINPTGINKVICHNCGGVQVLIPSRSEKHTKKSVIEDKKKQLINDRLLSKGGSKN